MMTVTFEGNLTDAPELRFTPAGVPVATMTVADNRRWQDKDGVWHDDATFLEITVWKDLAENAVASLTKGARVEGTGRLEQSNWINDAGEKRSRLRCVANSLSVSLRFAQIGSITKTSKPNPNEPDEAIFASDPTQRMPRPQLAAVPSTNGSDEEPF